MAQDPDARILALDERVLSGLADFGKLMQNCLLLERLNDDLAGRNDILVREIVSLRTLIVTICDQYMSTGRLGDLPPFAGLAPDHPPPVRPVRPADWAYETDFLVKPFSECNTDSRLRSIFEMLYIRRSWAISLPLRLNDEVMKDLLYPTHHDSAALRIMLSRMPTEVGALFADVAGDPYASQRVAGFRPLALPERNNVHPSAMYAAPNYANGQLLHANRDVLGNGGLYPVRDGWFQAGPAPPPPYQDYYLYEYLNGIRALDPNPPEVLLIRFNYCIIAFWLHFNHMPVLALQYFWQGVRRGDGTPLRVDYTTVRRVGVSLSRSARVPYTLVRLFTLQHNHNHAYVAGGAATDWAAAWMRLGSEVCVVLPILCAILAHGNASCTVVAAHPYTTRSPFGEVIQRCLVKVSQYLLVHC